MTPGILEYLPLLAARSFLQGSWRPSICSSPTPYSGALALCFAEDGQAAVPGARHRTDGIDWLHRSLAEQCSDGTAWPERVNLNEDQFADYRRPAHDERRQFQIRRSMSFA